MDDKLDRIEQRLDAIDVTLVRNTESLEYHIKRTDELQKHTELTTKHVLMVQGFVKIAVPLIFLTVAILGVVIKFN